MLWSVRGSGSGGMQPAPDHRIVDRSRVTADATASSTGGATLRSSTVPPRLTIHGSDESCRVDQRLNARETPFSCHRLNTDRKPRITT